MPRKKNTGRLDVIKVDTSMMPEHREEPRAPFPYTPDHVGVKPQMCPQTNCRCLVPWQYRQDHLDRGESHICFGEMRDTTKGLCMAGECEHRNDLFLCWWTSAKGWVQFHMNDGDMRTLEKIVTIWKNRPPKHVR